MKFSFGQNWLSYSRRALSQEKVAEAREAFGALLRGIDLRHVRFLDIGFGQGLSLFLAAEAGADVLGIDVDPICEEAIKTTHRFFPFVTLPKLELASILDDEFVRRQKEAGGFDVVHSWGVLHHTGNLAKAFQNAAGLTKKGGFLVISIYKRHWTSSLWRSAKYVFNHVPRFVQEGLVTILYPLFYRRARALANDEQSLTARGMDLRHDIRDWLGGYPYEYASTTEVEQKLAKLGFELVRGKPALGFTGCNEFVFRKIDGQERTETPYSAARQTA